MPKIADAYVEISAKLGKLRQKMGMAQGVVARGMRRIGSVVGRAMARVATALTNPFRLLRTVVAAVTGAFIVRAFARLAKSVADAADKVAKLSLRLGASVKALQEYRLVAGFAGVTFETFAMALQRMTRRVAEAAVGTGEAIDALKELGLSAAALNRMTPDEQFDAIAAALSRVSSQTDRVRLAFKLFDSEGVALVQIINQGADAIEKMKRRAMELGAVMSKEDVEAATRFKDASLELKTALDGVKNSLILPFLEELAPILSSMADWFAKNRFAVREWAESVASDFKTLADYIGNAATTIESYFKTAFAKMVIHASLFAAQAEEIFARVEHAAGRAAQAMAPKVGKGIAGFLGLFGEGGKKAGLALGHALGGVVAGEGGAAAGRGLTREFDTTKRIKALEGQLRLLDMFGFPGPSFGEIPDDAKRTKERKPPEFPQATGIGFLGNFADAMAKAIVTSTQTALGTFKVGQKSRQENLLEKQLRAQENMDRNIAALNGKVTGNMGVF